MANSILNYNISDCAIVNGIEKEQRRLGVCFARSLSVESMRDFPFEELRASRTYH